MKDATLREVIISNTRDSVSSRYSNAEKRVNNLMQSGLFLLKLEVSPMKHCLVWLI